MSGTGLVPASGPLSPLNHEVMGRRESPLCTSYVPYLLGFAGPRLRAKLYLYEGDGKSKSMLRFHVVRLMPSGVVCKLCMNLIGKIRRSLGLESQIDNENAMQCSTYHSEASRITR